jgi:MFS family permease
MDIDAIFREIGELGPQQRLYGGCMCLMNGYAAFHMLQYAFVSFAVDYTCLSQQGESLTNQCLDNKRDSCQDLQFSAEQSSSIVSEWGLVCEQNYKSKGTMSAFMAGVMLGAFVLGKLADSIGRKNSLTITVVGIIFFNTFSAITSSFQLYVVAKFCVGFFCAGNILAMFVLGNELVGPSKRGIFGLTLQSSFAVGIVILSLMAYQVQHWRHLTLLISIIGLPFISYHWLIPESPRWLVSQNRLHEAVKILEDIAKGNGTVLSEKVRLELDSPKKKDAVTDVKGNTEVLGDLMNHRQLCITTVIQLYSWFVNSAAYYGLTLAAGSAGGGLFTATALSGAVEIPAYILTNFLLDYYGRRAVLCVYMIGGGVSCLAIQLLASTAPSIVASCALLGKLCLAASFAVIYIHSGEIFPTTIRNSAMGLVSVAARVGGIMAPFIVLLGDYHPNLQFTVFGILSLSSGIINLQLPETMGKRLPDSVKEMIKSLDSKMSRRDLDVEERVLLTDASDSE